MGHSLIGVPLLSVGSLVARVFILLGSWTAGFVEMLIGRRPDVDERTAERG